MTDKFQEKIDELERKNDSLIELIEDVTINLPILTKEQNILYDFYIEEAKIIAWKEAKKLHEEEIARFAKISTNYSAGFKDGRKEILQQVEEIIKNSKVISENGYGNDDGTNEILLTKYCISRDELHTAIANLSQDGSIRKDEYIKGSVLQEKADGKHPDKIKEIK